MTLPSTANPWATIFLFGWLSSFNISVLAHGTVLAENDVCIVEIGFFKAHVTVYQPETSANEEFCEKIPDTGNTVFVLDYLHDSLKDMPVDFRIIKDLNNLGRYARWEDIEGLGNMNRDTVFYQPPVVRPGAALTVNVRFEETGRYLGIVSTKHATGDKTYNAVFPFKVGRAGFGYLPIIFGLILLVQLFYWLFNRGLDRGSAKD